MSTKRIVMTAAVTLGVAALFATHAAAGPQEDTCAALMDARGALVSMIDAKEKAAQDDFNTKIQAASGKLDQVLAGMGADKAAADFKVVWDQFKATRQNEIIPAVYAGKVDDAKKIATGVQAERLGKMRGIMSCK